MTRGHRESLLLRCRALSSPSPCRFIPALTTPGGCTPASATSPPMTSTQAAASRSAPRGGADSPALAVSASPTINSRETTDQHDPRTTSREPRPDFGHRVGHTARKIVPSVEGAITLRPKISPVLPALSTSMSSTLSAPVSIPCTSDMTLRPGSAAPGSDTRATPTRSPAPRSPTAPRASPSTAAQRLTW